MKTIYVHSIPNGTKFVAFYPDGSGCDLFRVTDGGVLIDSHGKVIGNSPDQSLMDIGFTEWMPIPKTFKFWYERKDGVRTLP